MSQENVESFTARFRIGSPMKLLRRQREASMRKVIVLGVLAALGAALLVTPASASFDHHFNVIAKETSAKRTGPNAFRFKDKLFDPQARRDQVGRDQVELQVHDTPKGEVPRPRSVSTARSADSETSAPVAKSGLWQQIQGRQGHPRLQWGRGQGAVPRPEQEYAEAPLRPSGARLAHKRWVPAPFPQAAGGIRRCLRAATEFGRPRCGLPSCSPTTCQPEVLESPRCRRES